MSIALAKLAEGGPDFPHLDGRGDRSDDNRRHGRLHLEIIVDRLLREFKVEANVSKPRSRTRKLSRKPATVDTRYVARRAAQAVCPRQVDHRAERGPAKGYEFEDDITAALYPRIYPLRGPGHQER